MINREIDRGKIIELQSLFPITAILGARQCGKTTLAKSFDYDHFFDLENPRHLAMFENPQLTLENLEGCIVIDEIQRVPELFPLLRYLVDTNSSQRYLILGSASTELIRQSSESLAGRIAYYHLGGLRLEDTKGESLEKHWFRGGFPKSFTAGSEKESNLWRENYIRTFLETDIPQLGIKIPSRTLRSFWTNLSHYHGQVINFSEIGRNFGMSDMTIRKYIDILEGTFMVSILRPWFSNTKKRLVKRPKIYIRDSGIFHSLQGMGSHKELLTHPKLGASWEGFAFESVKQILGKRDEDFYFWSTHSGAEIDLFWQNSGKNYGIEFKFSDAPRLTKSMQSAANDLSLEKLWVIYPGSDSYKLAKNIDVLPLKGAIASLK